MKRLKFRIFQLQYAPVASLYMCADWNDVCRRRVSIQILNTKSFLVPINLWKKLPFPISSCLLCREVSTQSGFWRHFMEYLPTFCDSKAWDFYPGRARAVLKTTQLYPKISEDIPNNSEGLKKMINLHTILKKSEISGKVSSFTHFTRTLVSFLALV